MNQGYLARVGCDYYPDPEENVLDSLFSQYERVIVESLITSFGLDSIIQDRHGGDVDTIFNVRKIGTDSEMTYKNVLNSEAYDSKEPYDYTKYHNSNTKNFNTKKGEARSKYRDEGTPVTDAYTGEALGFLGKSKGANPKLNAELDHVLSTKTIHEDRGRVLSGLKGEDLADASDNLQFTNKSLNASMGATKDKEGNPVDIPTYIELHPELPEETKANMMKSYNKASAAYESKLARAYYTSPRFAKDLARSAGTVGAKMGIRQVLGFVFAEIWFAVKEELALVGDSTDLKDQFLAIGHGVEQGVKNAKVKYRELLERFSQGALSGIISSITTTLCNIFFTTAKNTVRIIRQSWASVVQATNILLFNPDGLLFGERMRAAAKILAVGASVVAGVIIGDLIAKTGVGAIPVVGEIVQTFCGALVSGILSCTLLYFLDRSTLVNKLVAMMDYLPSISRDVAYFQQAALQMERYAAQLLEIDLETFQREVTAYNCATTDLAKANNEAELNDALMQVFHTLGIPVPWEGAFETFMNQKENVLVFE